MTYPEIFSSHMLQQQTTALNHSVELILSVVSGNITESADGEDLRDKMIRNMNHIITACEYPWFAGMDMSSYRAIAAQAQAWLQEHPPQNIK